MTDHALTYEDNQQSQSFFNVLSANVKGTITLMKSLMLIAKKLLMF
ncbi:hypothetical protein JoomaDRAFT_1400 [Galbibacter orientalis DSM 19592]|uniref:Uncharacterized protein n=1 Tax=Galbibacter orientalis DSM 19592 TaxID=926559 RepID=I3C472_9FLAO|nr:hypothetical protein JoomaDRAFT_1400 [Galbibacter orientalis DSM 19592]